MSIVILRRKNLGRTSCRELAARSGGRFTVVRNWTDPHLDVDQVIRWGCTSNVETSRVINTAAAIHKVSNKKEFRRILDSVELCPRTYFSTISLEAYCDEYGNEAVFPVIVRPATHHQGRNFHICNNYDELETAVSNYEEANYYISELINKVAEYRVFVVQGRVACVASKTPGNPDDIAWNVARGGRFDNVRWDDWPLQAVRKSIEAFLLSGLDFGGVDVIVDGEGESYILEINSAPSLTSSYRQDCMSKCLNYMIDLGKETIPLIEARGGYRKFIHPAVCERVVLPSS